jgi:hypothetical protein
MPAVYDCANGLGFAGLLRFSEPDPLRADAVESLLGAKLNDGVFAGLGGGESDALNVASEVVVGAWGKKLGAVFDCFVPSSGFANANGANEVLGALTTSGSGVFGAAKENAGSAGVLFGGAGGEVNVGKSDFWGELLGGESPPSSSNGTLGPVDFGVWLKRELGALWVGWLKSELGALWVGWLKGEAAVFGAVLLPAPLVVGVRLKPLKPESKLSFFVAKIESPDAVGAEASLFGWPNPKNPFDPELGVELNVGFELAGAVFPPRKLKDVGLDTPPDAGAASPPPGEAPNVPVDGFPKNDVSVFGCCVGCPKTDVDGASKSIPNWVPLEFVFAVSGMKSDSPSLTGSPLA